jgi:hypothetical protein
VYVVFEGYHFSLTDIMMVELAIQNHWEGGHEENEGWGHLPTEEECPANGLERQEGGFHVYIW